MSHFTGSTGCQGLPGQILRRGFSSWCFASTKLLFKCDRVTKRKEYAFRRALKGDILLWEVIWEQTQSPEEDEVKSRKSQTWALEDSVQWQGQLASPRGMVGWWTWCPEEVSGDGTHGEGDGAAEIPESVPVREVLECCGKGQCQ